MHPINRLNTRNLVPAALLCASTLLAMACSSDKGGSNEREGGAPDASTGGRQSGSGGTSAAGGAATGGSSTGGKVGSGGGTPGAGGRGQVDGGTADAGDASASDSGSDAADAAPPLAPLCADAGAATSALLVAGTNYCATCTTSEVAAVDVSHRCVLGRATFADSDVVPRASNHHAFVIERTNGALSALSDSGEVTRRIELDHKDGGAAGLNPHDVVYATPTGSAARAYVSLYFANAIAVVDVAGGGVSSRIDLASFHDASDADGSSDPDVGFYDATNGRAYFVLQRTDLRTADAPPYAIHCPSVPSLLIAIDSATNQLVDLNGATAGVALPLSLVGPTDVALDTVGHRALLLANGCVDQTGKRIHAGVESVNLDTLANAVLYTAPGDFPDHLTLLGPDSAAYESFDDNFATHWFGWQPSSSTLGPELHDVPGFAVATDANSLVGVAFDGTVPSVTRLDMTTKLVTKVVSSPWAGQFAAIAGVALVE